MRSRTQFVLAPDDACCDEFVPGAPGVLAASASPSKMVTNQIAEEARRPDWSRWAALCARVALGASFLSGIADRFGLYRGRNVGYGNFAGFVAYTAKVNAFMPPSTIPLLAWAATVAELFFGIALILGVWRIWVAVGSAVLLILFGTAMAISFGIKSPLDYSVFSASSAALLVAAYENRCKRRQ